MLFVATLLAWWQEQCQSRAYDVRTPATDIFDSILFTTHIVFHKFKYSELKHICIRNFIHQTWQSAAMSNFVRCYMFYGFTLAKQSQIQQS